MGLRGGKGVGRKVRVDEVEDYILNLKFSNQLNPKNSSLNPDRPVQNFHLKFPFSETLS